MMSKLERFVMVASLTISLITASISAKTVLTPSNYVENSTKLKPEAHKIMKDYCPLTGASLILATICPIPNKRRVRYYNSID